MFAVVFTGVACSALALPLQLWGQRRIPATRAALILLAEPVFAGIAGYVDGERLGAARLVGAVTILAGIGISEFWPRRPLPHPAGVRHNLPASALPDPSGAGPSGAGPSGAGPSGTGPSGTGPSEEVP